MSHRFQILTDRASTNTLEQCAQHIHDPVEIVQPGSISLRVDKVPYGSTVPILNVDNRRKPSECRKTPKSTQAEL